MAHPGDRHPSRARCVALNALFLDPAVSGGPETYLRELAPALREARPESQLTVITTRRGAASLRAAGWPEQGLQVRLLPCDDGQRLRRQWAEQVLLPFLAQRIGAQVLHSLASVAPIRVPSSVAHVITVHDVNFLRHPTFNRITTWGMGQVVPRAARRADGLIADAASSRTDTCATLHIAPSSFTVIPLGVAAPAERTAPDHERLRARFGLRGRRLVLCVGAKRPHKNQELLLRALLHLPQDVDLVLAGHAEPYELILRRLADQLGISNRVSFAGWVEPAELEGLWALADVAAVPTRAEGFGLPVLEAMARGVATAASDLPVLREVAEDWPRYFNPDDAEDAAAAICSLLENPPDPESGRSRAARFTWQACAEATWGVYDRALARRAGFGAGERRLVQATTAV